jgi:hypothetical protein
LFWTIPFDSDAIDVQLGDGEASMRAKHFRLPDFVSIPNSLFGSSSAPAVVSFDVRWEGPGKRVTTRDDKSQFAGDFVENTATIKWSGRTGNFQFRSDPKTTNEFSELGRERNGIFFTADGAGDD